MNDGDEFIQLLIYRHNSIHVNDDVSGSKLGEEFHLEDKAHSLFFPEDC
jgi:hypothetical protein